MARSTLLIGLLALLGCNAYDPEVEAICDHIFAVCTADFGGWTDQKECYKNFLEDGSGNSTCTDPDPYYACTEECMTMVTCDEFEACDTICFNDNCG